MLNLTNQSNQLQLFSIIPGVQIIIANNIQFRKWPVRLIFVYFLLSILGRVNIAVNFTVLESARQGNVKFREVPMTALVCG